MLGHQPRTVSRRLEELQDTLNTNQGGRLIVNLTPGGDTAASPNATVLFGPWCRNCEVSGKSADTLVTAKSRLWRIDNTTGVKFDNFSIQLGDYHAKDAVFNGTVVKEGKGDKLVQVGDSIWLTDSHDCEFTNMRFGLSMDEIVGITRSSGNNFYRCVFHHALNKSYQLVKNSDRIAEHSYGTLITSTDSGHPNSYVEPNVFQQCLFANTLRRLPQLSTEQSDLDIPKHRRVIACAFINNIFYNFDRPMHHDKAIVSTVRADYIGCIWKYGPNSPNKYWKSHWAGLQRQLDTGGAYFKDCWVIDKSGTIHSLEDWTTQNTTEPIDWSNRKQTPNFDLDGPAVITNSAKMVERSVIRYSGPYTHRNSDSVRDKIIDDYNNGTGTIIDAAEELYP